MTAPSSYSQTVGRFIV